MTFPNPRYRVLAAALLPAALLAGCVTTRQTDPPVTATEQLLISTAVDRSAARLQLPVHAGSKVYLDTQFLDADPTVRYPRYTVGAIRGQLLREGLVISTDRFEADVVAEVRSGAQSIDDDRTLVGLPSITLPVPLAGALVLPEIPLFKYLRQTGHSKIAITAYDRDGKLIADTGAQFGEANQIYWVVLFVFSHTSHDLTP